MILTKKYREELLKLPEPRCISSGKELSDYFMAGTFDLQKLNEHKN